MHERDVVADSGGIRADRGDSNGAAQAGMLRATAEVHLEPDLVTGTSVGALNGAVLAERPDLGPARLLEIWAGLSRSDVFTDGLATRLANLVRSRRYLYSGRGLRKLASGHLRADEFSDLAIPFAAVATDVKLSCGLVRWSRQLLPAPRSQAFSRMSKSVVGS